MKKLCPDCGEEIKLIEGNQIEGEWQCNLCGKGWVWSGENIFGWWSSCGDGSGKFTPIYKGCFEIWDEVPA